MTNQDDNLVVLPETKNFVSSQKEYLFSSLSAVEDETLVLPLTDVGQLYLESDLTTSVGKAKIAWLAFKQICHHLSEHMVGFIKDFGRISDSEKPKSFYSPVEASLIFNMVLKRRFDTCLSGRHIIKNMASNVIEALINDSRKRMPGVKFLEMVDDLLSDKYPSYSFESASMHGRKIIARYKVDSSILIDPQYSGYDLGDIHSGMVFSNDEYDDNLARVSVYISFGKLGLCCFPHKSVWKVSYNSSDFRNNFESLVSVVDKARSVVDSNYMSHFLTKACSTSLNLRGVEAKDKFVISNMARQLVFNHMTPYAADRAVKRAVYSFVDKGKIVVSKVDKSSSWPNKSVIDLFVSLLIESSEAHSLSVRDNIEQLAFKLLCGKVKV